MELLEKVEKIREKPDVSVYTTEAEPSEEVKEAARTEK